MKKYHEMCSLCDFLASDMESPDGWQILYALKIG